jgi:adenylate kinase
MFHFDEFDGKPALMDEDTPIAIFDWNLQSLDEIDEMVKALQDVRADIKLQLDKAIGRDQEETWVDGHGRPTSPPEFVEGVSRKY